MKKQILKYVIGEDTVLDKIFKQPPKKPDSRMFFLGGCGLITMVRGAYTLFGRPPQAEVFIILGPWFIVFWSWIWMFVGFTVMLVAGSGHWKPDLDRAAAFLLMSIWWVWSLLYLLSAALPQNPERWADLLNSVILAATGLVLTAGIIQGIRKTQEIRLKELAIAQLKQLEAEVIIIAAENRRLRELGDLGVNEDNRQG